MKLRYVNNDGQHAYYIDGKRAKGVTSVAKYPDNTYNLEQWSKRMVAIGLAMNPVYVEAVAAHFDDRHKLDDYVEKALVAAKAQHGADRGMAAHRITERHDLGEPILDTPLALYIVASWQAALEAADLEVIPEYVERIIVHDKQRIAGRFDRILRHRASGELFIGDVKAGENALKWPHSMACQLALYANAPLIAGHVPDEGGETDQFGPMPEVNKEWGYIFHLPDSGEAAVAQIDIAAGWKAVQRIIFPTIDWRDKKDLCRPVATIVGGGDVAPRETTGVHPSGTPTDTKLDKLRARYKRLPDKKKGWVMRHLPDVQISVESYELGLALVRFAELDVDDDLLRACVAKAVGKKLSVRKTVSDILATVTLDQATALSTIAVDIHDGRYAIRYTEDGVHLDAA